MPIPNRSLPDSNFAKTLIGVSSVDLSTPVALLANPTTGALLIDSTSLYAGLDTRYLKLAADNDPLTGDLGFAEGFGISSIDNIQFDITPTNTTSVEGKMRWDSTEIVPVLGIAGGYDLPLLKSLFKRVKNDSGGTLNVGDVVYISGSTGSTFAKVKKANANNIATSYVLGMVFQKAINDQQFGIVVEFGYIRNINTLGMAYGTPVWLATTDGGFTQTRPDAPNMSVFLGYVIRAHATEGSIALRPTVIPRTTMLSDVYISSLTGGDLLQWDGSDLRWENKSLATIADGTYLRLDGTNTMTGNLNFSGSQKIIGGSGTTSDLTLQTTSGVGTTGADMHFLVGNNGATEAMTILNGGNVGIGTTSPDSRLHILGTNNQTGGITIESSAGATADRFAIYPSGNYSTFFKQLDAAGLTSFINSSDQTILYLGNNQKIGVGTTSYTNTLTVAGNSSIGSGYTGVSAPSNGLIIEGNVGIGTTAPGAKLQVNGAASAITSVFKANATAPGNITEWQNSSGTNLLWITNVGELRVYPTAYTHGSYTIKYGGVVQSSYTANSTNDGAGYVENFQAQTIVNATTSNAKGHYIGGDYLSFAANVDLGRSITKMVGLAPRVYGYDTNFEGNIATAMAIDIDRWGLITPVAATGSITNLYGLNLSSPTKAEGSITNIYGIYLNNINVATLNYAIYTNLGDVRFGDDVILNGADSDKLWLGAGKDMSLYYDGTSGYIKTSDVAASDLHITCGTDKTLVLDESVWNDIQFPISSGRVAVANAPNWETFTTNTSAYAFSVDDYIDLQTDETPHGWSEGTNGSVHLHFALKTAQSSGADRFAKFTVWMAISDVNGVWSEIGPFTAEYTIPTGSAALTHFLLTLGSATLTGYHTGMQIKARVKRIAATGGTEYADDVYITQVGMHVETVRIGSRTVSAA